MDAGQLFAVDPLERQAARGHGAVTSMAAGSDVIVLGTSHIDLGGGRSGDHTVHRVFLDPGGKHCVVTVIHPGGAETYYHHARWPRPKPLPRLRGLLVNAVAWNRQAITEASTKEVILGTEAGQIFEMAVDEADKKEKYVKLLFELTELREGIKDLQMETAVVGNATRYYVMAVTPTRLYSFTGIGSLETVFASYTDRAIHFMELPGEIPNSSTSGDENFVENKGFFDYSKLGDSNIKPSSFAVSEFHFLLLIEDKIKVVNRISQQIVEELVVDNTPESSKGIIGLCSDASTGVFYAFDETSIFQVSTSDEGRDMWQVYLDMKAYAVALSHCLNPFQRDQVYLVQADAAFAAKEYYIAASFYAKMNYILSFEEISLKFISVGEQDALRTFLLRRLDNLTKDDKMQITMISTWATELYLDKINRLLLEDGTGTTTNTVTNSNSSAYRSVVDEFRAFLSDSKDVLDEATTMILLESYGRVDELVYFAGLKEQYEIVVHHYIQYKFAPDLIMLDAYETVESWMMARNKLNPGKLIPAMMRYMIYECKHVSNSRRNETHEVIKYLEFCVKDLNNEDPGVHNLLLSLYSKKADESQLLQFLDTKFGSGQANGPEFFYEPQYALRLCLQAKRMRACVRIYSMMSMHEEAVALALRVDLELAKAEADKVEDDEELRKKLWLKVAKHVIEQEKGVKRENIKKAIEFLSETNNLLKIEDILPFFPDFVLIDDFKEEICKSLKDYNSQIEQLKAEMDDATRGADNIRSDIGALAQRFTVIDREEECGVLCDNKSLVSIPLQHVCRRKILTVGGLHQVGRSYTSVGHMAPFYVFPCGHAFHANCLIAHVTRCTSQVQAARILNLQKQLSLMDRKAAKDNGGTGNGESTVSSAPTVDKLRSQLDDAVASECPFCGDLMIKEISLPFILPGESVEKASWEIKPQPASQKILPMTMSI
uniref:Vacuolar sorting-associated protein 18-like protein n=1 Tax=Aegilops tauschii TaxID=37682 RepID=M8D7E9_AEGTA